MLDRQRMEAAGDILWDAWQEGRHIPSLPEALRPASRAEGYAVQARFERRSARPILGWKIAATSAAGQAHIGVDGPLAGRMLAEAVHPDGATLSLGANRMLVAEVEFGFRLARSLPPRSVPYTQAEVMAAVAALHLVMEVPDSRFDDFVTAGGPQLIADNACAHQFVLGSEVRADWRGLDLAAHRVVARVAGKAECEGCGANVLGDPRIALTWLANELSQHGLGLAEDQIVTTGTCVTPFAIAPGDSAEGDFGPLGGISARFLA